MTKIASSLCVFLLFTCSLSIAQSGKVEPIGAAPSAVPQAVRGVLEDKGFSLKQDDGAPLCDLWLRKSVPSQPKKDSQDVLYTQLPESTLVGVISFPQATTDFRGQAIKPGTYTLRYELIPNDGNHLGVSPNRDFLLLVPADADVDPNATFKFQDLVSMSRKATGTRHPGPLSLTQPGDGSAPSLAKDDQEHWIFSAGMKLVSGEELPFGLIVKGTAQQ